MKLKGFRSVAYAWANLPGVTVELRVRDGKSYWGVFRGRGIVLATVLGKVPVGFRWIVEPYPSNRTAYHYQTARFPSLSQAVEAAAQMVANDPETEPEPEP